MFEYLKRMLKKRSVYYLSKNQLEYMTFKEFDKWINQRAQDGLWNMSTASLCLNVFTDVILGHPFYKEWYWHNRWEADMLTIINPTNQQIADNSMLKELEACLKK
jgi:hypothetical protein